MRPRRGLSSASMDTRNGILNQIKLTLVAGNCKYDGAKPGEPLPSKPSPPKFYPPTLMLFATGKTTRRSNPHQSTAQIRKFQFYRFPKCQYVFAIPSSLTTPCTTTLVESCLADKYFLKNPARLLVCRELLRSIMLICCTTSCVQATNVLRSCATSYVQCRQLKCFEMLRDQSS